MVFNFLIDRDVWKDSGFAKRTDGVLDEPSLYAMRVEDVLDVARHDCD